jgi:hypothetical protein
MSATNEHGHALEWVNGDGEIMVIDPDSNPMAPSYVLKNPKPAKKAKKSQKAKKE